jgi:hypothetical protein
MNARIARGLTGVLLVIGCASTPEPTLPAVGSVFAVPVHELPSGTITAYVRDDAGIALAVREGAPPDPRQGGATDVAAEIRGDRLWVAWLGGVCRFGPTVTLAGTADALVVTVRPEDGAELPPGIECDSIGMFFAVEVLLSTPVAQDHIVVELKQ